jgi:hypothetical protein
MKKLILFQTEDGRSVFINPRKVVMITAVNEEMSVVRLDGDIHLSIMNEDNHKNLTLLTGDEGFDLWKVE